ncbi:succinyl-diaminopimelate desuccinylase [Rathayibacter toxicus]|uniref:Succinyl-diaminopimelate desuccinylase n=1 Tax=Rathayibacter toxicus TaxID=145458 RepID=A0A2S5Y690_9MICO|nr:succinyl-diaminopimelate desuccinylase [Rathayibacter toxicus]PPH22644.1 succinyl-diaminopimelate desuccinylase [Rathayibacter toxicus]PPH56846.1 succinyl-diaminopimelate desuccinylase [Rathayibacter toxicus]PPH59538.1 succinyl-diaminopimelate desuccinylase [Rathayibacter toxicus]PPH86768.1 succinyl-diaminopimelate desuccinylase [Rathayibacter toxicus]PPI14486.1 succinyl-diaminopimelate desuccinylase [Rathayibacter toxicus]
MVAQPFVIPLNLRSDPIALTRALCDIPSVSGEELVIADALESALGQYPHLEVIRDGNTVVARTDLARPQRVIIAGHLDTVAVNNNLPVTDATIDGVQYLVGRGTVDMKAGVAVQLVLAAELVDPTMDITWIWYDNEEVGSELNGLGRLFRHRPDLFAADFAVLGEPTCAAVEGGCNGTLRVNVVARGVRAHSARSWVGENAVHAAEPILRRLAAYQPREVDVDGLIYREGLNAVGISGGVAGNVIPDLCSVHVNYRFAPSRSGEEAIAHLRELFVGFEVDIVDLAEGARPGLDVPLVAEFLAAVGAEAKPKYGWTDVARFGALGIPAVNYGPGDAVRAHADDERVAVAEITACADGLRRWLGAMS